MRPPHDESPQILPCAISADTVYHRAFRGAFDLVIAQYHDQGHIPIKLVAFDTAVNVSLGLPIRRCSVARLGLWSIDRSIALVKPDLDARPITARESPEAATQHVEPRMYTTVHVVPENSAARWSAEC